jgi:HEAT repeat protein
MKRRILLAAVLFAVLGAIAWLLCASSPPDPIYEGRPLSSWLRQRSPPTIISKNGRVFWIAYTNIATAKTVVPAFAAAANTNSWIVSRGPLRQSFPNLDSNAIPRLARALATRDWLLLKPYNNIWPRLPAALRKHLPEPVPAHFIRQRAAELLWRVPGDLTPALPALVRALETDEDGTVRNSALQALAWMSERDPKLVTNLLQAMAANSDATIRREAKEALEQIPAKPELLVPVFIRWLKDPQVDFRREAAFALRVYGSDARPAAEALLAALNDSNDSVRWNAACALGEMRAKPDATVPALTLRLKDTEPDVRQISAKSLGLFANDAKPAVPALLEMLKSNDGNDREAAATALKQIDPDSAAKAGIK